MWVLFPFSRFKKKIEFKRQNKKCQTKNTQSVR